MAKKQRNSPERVQEMADPVEAVARAHYAEITKRVADKIPGAPFRTWEQLPPEQREDQLAAIRAAMSADPIRKALIEALERIRMTPPMPFPDPDAHSWRAYALAIRAAWNDIQSIAATALSLSRGEKP